LVSVDPEGRAQVPIIRAHEARIMKVLGVAGYSGSGKTTLLEQLVPRLVARGLRVSVVKHAHHAVEIDRPGKDSWRHRAAGAQEVLVTSSSRWAIVRELRGAAEPTLEEHIARLSPCDLVLVEGWKRSTIPKLEMHRRAGGRPSLWDTDANIVAVATDEPLPTSLPQFGLDAYDAIVEFLLDYLALAPRA
jgi:molybdopterin-guanine dinucleotide biosynthesis protein B